MGLSLVSKVAPRRHRGLVMGGWFVATAIGNKLTQIGQLWTTFLIPRSGSCFLVPLPSWRSFCRCFEASPVP